MLGIRPKFMQIFGRVQTILKYRNYENAKFGSGTVMESQLKLNNYQNTSPI